MMCVSGLIQYISSPLPVSQATIFNCFMRVPWSSALKTLDLGCLTWRSEPPVHRQLHSSGTTCAAGVGCSAFHNGTTFASTNKRTCQCHGHKKMTETTMPKYYLCKGNGGGGRLSL